MDRRLRFVLRHRRLIASLSAGLAVFLGLTAVTAEPPGQTVLIARRDLASGVTLRSVDLQEVKMPSALVHNGAATVRHDVVGRTTAGPMREGEVLTDLRTVSAGRLDGYGKGRVLSVVRVTDPSVLALVRPGDPVDVLAVAGEDKLKARRVAHAVPVVTLPRHRATFSEGAPVGLAVTPGVALKLAERALDSRLSVVVAQAP